MIYFLTGTNTDCGKTLVASAILTKFLRDGASTLGLKPIASGCENTTMGLCNKDALMLMNASSLKLNYNEVNPFAFKAAIAPHIEASLQNIELSLSSLNEKIDLELYKYIDVTIIEGAGGWHLPLTKGLLSDWVIEHKLPVIIVIDIDLGCLNHAILTQEAILNKGLKIAGWVANHTKSNILNSNDMVAYLLANIKAPCLGIIPFIFQATPEKVLAFLDFKEI